MPYPIKLKPFYRHGSDTPWGGCELSKMFRRELPDDTTGESLEASAIKGKDSVIENGSMRGKTLLQAFDDWGEKLTGGKYGEFPLLVKLIDAKRTLSVQVHPGNDYALKNENKLGKSECWLILKAKPGARLVCGLKPGSDDIENRLVFMDVSAGDAVYIPSGMVHAIGEGIVLYELQQSSDVTYRLWDWGSGRELHLKKAMDVADTKRVAQKAVGRVSALDSATVTRLINCEYFSLSKAMLRGKMAFEQGRMSIITALCDCVIECDGEADDERRVRLNPGETAIIPASVAASVTGTGDIIVASATEE